MKVTNISQLQYNFTWEVPGSICLLLFKDLSIEDVRGTVLRPMSCFLFKR